VSRTRAIQYGFIDILYAACRVVALPLLVFYFLYRCARDRRYLRRFAERLGFGSVSFQATPPGSIWLHAVSVGEVASAVTLIAELRAHSPGTALYLSVGTVAGREVAEQRLAGKVNGIFYAPLDYAFAVRRVLRRIRPAMLVVLETEIWPVLFRETKRTGCDLVMVNARISDRAFPRYRDWRFVFRPTLQRVDAIFAQSEQDRTRYVELGAAPDRVRAVGNLKYDAAPPAGEAPRFVRHLLAKLAPSAVWIAASTMAGVDGADVDEDEAVIAAFQELSQLHLGLLLVLVPRKPERFDAAEDRLRRAAIRHVRRSREAAGADLTLPCVVLLDSIGELASLFPLADVVFMGGTLARRGGHNLLEPAASGRAIVSGTHLENFAAIAADFREHGAMLEIAGPAELAPSVGRLLDDHQLRAELGARALEVAERRRGVAGRIAQEVLARHDAVAGCVAPRGVTKLPLGLLSAIWRLGSEFKQFRDVSRARRLETPVLSIGGISMGGAGKTPLVDYLAEQLHQRGLQPAILTRGYRRRSIEPSIVIEAGEEVPVPVTGDEAQIYLRAGNSHTGIGADRWATGRMVEKIYQPDVFLLDDGFQHRRLKRDLDLVLLDALNPLAGGEVFPLGRLREPPSALSRADAFVLMRAASEREYAGLRALLHDLNPGAPIFRARFEPRYWVNHRTERLFHPPEGPAVAFCGLGNPASFWNTLRTMRIHPAFTWSFADHHRYQHADISRLAAQAHRHGASVLLCTEKDAMNMPERSIDMLLDENVELYWLKIAVEVEQADALFALIERKISGSRSTS